MPHWLTSTVMATGSTRLTSSAWALMVVQRQSAASRSATPDSSGQHFSLALLPPPTTACTSPLSASTHATSFSVSTGHFPVGVDGVGVTGVGVTGVGVYGGGGHGTEDGGGGGLSLRGGGGGGGVGVGQVGQAADGASWRDRERRDTRSSSGAMRGTTAMVASSELLRT